MERRIPQHLVDEIEKARDALLAIAYMDVLTRDGEEPPHETMRKIALKALESE